VRRSDREVTNPAELADILRRADTIRLALHDEPYPYIVPLSYGFEVENGTFLLYFHGAKQGRKHDLIAKNPRVCVEASIMHRYAETPQGITTVYESVIGEGTVRRVEGAAAARGLDLLLAHCGYENYACPQADMDMTWVYQITLESVTGKRREV